MTNLLEHSREYFARYGGAWGALVQGKHVCALGAVRMAGNEERLNMPLSPDPDYLLYNLETNDVVSMLDAKSAEVYDYETIAEVNDWLGVQAVLHVFDLCIKDSEAKEYAGV